MGQNDVLELLKKQNKWMSVKEIAEKLKITTVGSSIIKLLRQGEIMKREYRDKENKRLKVEYKWLK